MQRFEMKQLSRNPFRPQRSSSTMNWTKRELRYHKDADDDGTYGVRFRDMVWQFMGV